MKAKGINRDNMYGVFHPSGHLVPYSIARNKKGAIGNFCGGPDQYPWKFWLSEGYFTHRIHCFIVPIVTIKEFKKHE